MGKTHFLLVGICILLVVAIVSGFDFSVLKKDNLRGQYPDIAFEDATLEFVSSAKQGLSSSFSLLKTAKEFSFKALKVFTYQADTEVPDGWSEEDVYYFNQLMSIENKLSAIDRTKLHMANNVIEAPAYLEELYFKYFGD